MLKEQPKGLGESGTSKDLKSPMEQSEEVELVEGHGEVTKEEIQEEEPEEPLVKPKADLPKRKKKKK